MTCPGPGEFRDETSPETHLWSKVGVSAYPYTSSRTSKPVRYDWTRLAPPWSSHLLRFRYDWRPNGIGVSGRLGRPGPGL